MPLLMWRNGLRNCWRQVWCLLWCAWSNKRVLPSLMHVGNVLQGENQGRVGIFFFLHFLCKVSLDAISYGRVFLALVEKQEDRGTVVAQGGGKVWKKYT